MKNIEKMLVFLVAFAFFGVSVNAINITKTNDNKFLSLNYFDENDADNPAWSIGDSWTYNLEQIKGQIGTTMDFEISSPNLKMEVIEVSENNYKLSISGDINGNGHAGLGGIELGGTFQNARIAGGYILVNKKNLTVYEMHDVRIKGDLKGAILTYSFDATVYFYSEPLLAYVKLPLSVSDTWTIPFTYIVFEVDILVKNKLTGVTLLDDAFPIVATVGEHDLTCEKQETVNNYESLKITGDMGDVQSIWFSKFAGSIVQVDVQNLDMEMYSGEIFELTLMKIKLTETNYHLPPSTPEKPDGPTSGRAGPEYTYCTEGGIDPENKQVQYGFDFGDESDIVWSEFVASGSESCVSHGFPWQGGSFEIKAKTKDKDGKESGWSETLTVTMTADSPPSAPSTPQGGQTEGIVGYSYRFTVKATDPEGDRIKYGFDLYGDGTVDQWSDLFNSGENANVDLIWKKVGTFNMKVKAQDEYGASSDWSQTVQVSMINNNPETPSFVQKTTKPKQDKTYTYSATGSDPDGHRIQFEFSWGDGKTSKSDLVESGGTGSASHSWNDKGSVTIRVRAIDEYGATSDWADLPITVPKTKTYQFRLSEKLPFLQKLLSLPMFERILQKIL